MDLFWWLSTLTFWDLLVYGGYGVSLMVLCWTTMTVLLTPWDLAFICFRGSKSFFFASMFYPLAVRNRIFAFYAFARLGDDLIDEYQGEALRRKLLFLEKILDFWYSTDLNAKRVHREELKSMLSSMRSLPETFSASNAEKMMLCLDGIIADCAVPRWSFELLLFGFKMDTMEYRIEDEHDLLTYCLCVASSIGIICTFLYRDESMVMDKELLTKAASLGIAFQITNMARDIITDLTETHKVYVPRSWMDSVQRQEFEGMLHGTVDPEHHRNGLIRSYAVSLVQMAEVYYVCAWNGIQSLPKSVRFAVYSALLIYREIGAQILRQKTYPNRARTTLQQKVSFILCPKKPNFGLSKAMEHKNRAYQILQDTIKRLDRQ